MKIKTAKELAGFIDHTLLKADADSEQITTLCNEAVKYGFYAVCVHTRWIATAADMLEASNVKVTTVISFPHGADSTRIKIAQANRAIQDGADEIDMVADLAAIKNTNGKYLSSQLRAMARLSHAAQPKVALKVIIEAAAFGINEKMFACGVASEADADFVKTSTGFHEAGGATVEDVRLMKDAASGCKVKAAGGIRTAKQVLAMIKAGASRIGTSSGVEIIEQFNQQYSR